MNLREREIELAWLTKKVNTEEGLIGRMESYVDENRHRWSNGLTATTLDVLEEMKQRLYYEQFLLEKLAWDVIQAREIRDADSRISSKIRPLR